MTDSFEEEVTKFDLGFTSVLISLLDKISQVISVMNVNKQLCSSMSFSAENPDLTSLCLIFIACPRKLQREDIEYSTQARF